MSLLEIDAVKPHEAQTGKLCSSFLDRCCTTPTPIQSPSTLVVVLRRSLSPNIQQDPLKILEFLPFKTKRIKYAAFTFKYSETDVGCMHTYKIQSKINSSEMSSVGSPTDTNTITMETMPACGMPAAPVLAAVTVKLKRETVMVTLCYPCWCIAC